MKIEGIIEIIEDQLKEQLSDKHKLSIEFAFKQGALEAMKNLTNISAINNAEFELLTVYISKNKESKC